MALGGECVVDHHERDGVEILVSLIEKNVAIPRVFGRYDEFNEDKIFLSFNGRKMDVKFL